jgi:hypothetical protein
MVPNDDCLLLLELPRSRASTGAVKLKARNALPQVFIVVSSAPRRVIGAMLVCEAYETRSGEGFIVPSKLCTLVSPIPLITGQLTKSNGTFKLSVGLEAQTRLAEVNGGANLNAHFSAFARDIWRCWAASDEEIKCLQGPSLPRYLKVPITRFQAMGVDPVSIRGIGDIAPTLDGVCVGDTISGIGVDVETEHASNNSEAMGGARSSQERDDASRAAQRLHGLVAPLSGGVVTHSFPPHVLLVALQLRSKLKLNTSISDGLAAAAPLLFSEAAPCFVRELLGVSLPSEALLREATVRLELLATL